MRPFMKNAISYLVDGYEARRSASIAASQDVIVSGYSYLTDEFRRESESDPNEKRRVGIIYADIVEYSRLAGHNDEGTQHRLNECLKAMQAYILANNGRIVHFAGDAILAEFTDADKALNCAINMQLSDRRRNAHLNTDQQIRFRIGVNYGDVISGQSVFGNDVNLAERLENLAHSGGICVSESVRQRLKSSPSFNFLSMGKQYLKNISDPVEVFWIEFDSKRVEPVDQSFDADVSTVIS